MAGLRLLVRGLCSRKCFTNANFAETLVYKRLKHNQTFSRVSPESVIIPKWTTGERHYSAYEAEGKTIAVIINKRSVALCVDSVNTYGFVLSTGVELVGATILFPHSLFSWNVTTARDLTEDSFVLFKVMEPKVDLLILGYGNKTDYTPEVRQKFTKICKNLGVRFEALPTNEACGLFNFLSNDHMFVAGAFIPPTSIDLLKWDRSKLKEDKLKALEDGDEEEKLLLEDKSKDSKSLN